MANSTNDDGSDGGYVLGLLTDPGLPSRIGRWLQRGDRLANRLQKATGYQWQVCVVEAELSLDPEGHLPVAAHGREAMAEHGCDAVILMSDLPRRTELGPILADHSSDAPIAMLSVPALGGLLTRARALTSICDLVDHHLSPALWDPTRADKDESTQPGSRPASITRIQTGHLRTALARVDAEEEEIGEHVILLGARGRIRLLAGMVRANRPWRLLPSLAPALAGAGAGAAFGIFYSNIWMLADAFSLWRFAMVSGLAVVVMILWLMGYNGLWERRSDHGSREHAVLANIAITATITTAVIYMYVFLFIVALTAAFMVIPSTHLATNVGHPVTIADYAKLAWLATSMGTIAGALGSGLSDEEAVKQATYSRREYQRRQRREAQHDEEG